MNTTHTLVVRLAHDILNSAIQNIKDDELRIPIEKMYKTCDELKKMCDILTNMIREKSFKDYEYDSIILYVSKMNHAIIHISEAIKLLRLR